MGELMVSWYVLLLIPAGLILLLILRVGCKWVWGQSFTYSDRLPEQPAGSAGVGERGPALLQEDVKLTPPPGFKGRLDLAARLEQRARKDHSTLKPLIKTYRRILRRLRPAEHLDFRAGVLNRLGSAYLRRPNVSRAESMERAVACYQEALRYWGPSTNPLGYALTQHNLGDMYARSLVGDREAKLKQALRCYQEALRFRRPESVPLQYAETQYALGLTHMQQRAGGHADNLLRAIECFEEALRYWTPDANPLGYAKAQDGLGVAYTDIAATAHANRSRALTYAIKCFLMSLRFRTLENTPFEYAATRLHLGDAYLRVPDEQRVSIEHAIECFKQALLVFKSDTAPHEYALLNYRLGDAHFSRELGGPDANQERAIECYQEALRYWTPETTPYGCRSAHQRLATIYFGRRNWDAALRAYRTAIEVGEVVYRAGLSSESKAFEMSINADLYNHAAFLTALSGDAAEAVLILERGKTRVLAEALQLGISRPDNVPDTVWESFVQARASLKAIPSVDNIALGESWDSVGLYAAYERRILAASAELEQAVDHVQTYAPDFLKAIDLSVSLSLLPDDRTALVMFCITEQGSIAFLISKEQTAQVQKVEVADFTLDTMRGLLYQDDGRGEPKGGWLVDYINYLNEPNYSNFEALLATMTEVLQQISQSLLSPVLARLRPPTEKLIIIPSGALFLLPLHAAPLASAGSETVCDGYEISYAPSIKVLANSHAQMKQEEEAGSLYAVINPEEDSQLSCTSTEGIAIAKCFKDAKVERGWGSTKETVAAGVRGRSYVHFACHGNYRWFKPLESGLSLSNERLTLRDLQQGGLDLSKTRLVTLSACETGIPDFTLYGTEEYVGLPAGFMLAGAPCVVSSLWVVPELSTALLMERFYNNHLVRRMDFAAALSEALVWVRKLKARDVADYAETYYKQSTGRDRIELLKHVRHYRYLAEQDPSMLPFVHPYYWAAFTANGV
jgi:CHAT domain-containing protein/tetratricopeptide (TPR) repeat protein